MGKTKEPELQEGTKETFTDIKAYKKKGKAPSLTYTLDSSDAFYLNSPVSKEDVEKLDEYSKGYTERAMKSTTVFATDAFKNVEDLEEVEYELPYRNNKVKLVYIKDKDDYAMHVEYDTPHMSHGKEIKLRNRALNQAIAEG